MATTSASALPAPPPLTDGCALFLDVDGSLLEFAPTPDRVQVPTALLGVLERVHRRLGGALALVSGRSLAQLDRLFAPLRLPAAGLHGLELRDAPAPPRPPQLGTVRERLEAVARRFPGALVEDKRVALALHWRAAPQAAEALRAAADEAVGALPGYRLQHGDHVVELRPHGADKGSAVQQLLAQPPFRGRHPVFVGDDITDEDGFRVMRERDGVAVLVGERRPTAATHALTHPAAVRAWLCEAAGEDAPVPEEAAG
ncbi:MAG TPA: trehalose-phosphatase [Lysobacter sp.]|nr:trehalose-phosphatase [Lysobacter sp.]